MTAPRPATQESPDAERRTLAGQPLIAIAGRGTLKLIFLAIPWALFGLPLLILGAWMTIYEAVYTHETVVVYLGCGCVAAGWVLSSFMVCRLRAAFDPRIEFLAGPGGIVVACPSAPRLARLLLAYRINTHEVRADQLEGWHPDVMKVHGITTVSRIVFRSKGRRPIRVDTKFFNASRDSLVLSIAAALAGWKNTKQ
jgi:hypothetical protein